MIPEDPVPVSPSTPPPADIEGERPVSIPPYWQRLPFTVRRGFWSVGATSAVIGLVYTAMAGGPQRRGATAAPKPAKPAPVASRVVPDPVPVAEEREALVEGLVRSQKKRIMG